MRADYSERMTPKNFIAKWGAPNGVPEDEVLKRLLALNLVRSSTIDLDTK